MTGLVECYTHAVVAAAIAPYSHRETTMAAEPAQKFKPDMLVLVDRNFYGFGLWRKASASGARLVWRVKANLKLAVQHLLPDDSYLSEVFESADKRRSAGQAVRVIDYTLAGSAAPVQDRYRLVTNTLDSEEAPTLELAALYHDRWEIEGVFDEFKTHLRGQHGAAQQNARPCLPGAALMTGSARHLTLGGVLVTYEPYLEADVPSSGGNLAFDQSLRACNPAWGIRKPEDVEAVAVSAGLQLADRHVMPANNLLLEWKWGGRPSSRRKNDNEAQLYQSVTKLLLHCSTLS